MHLVGSCTKRLQLIKSVLSCVSSFSSIKANDKLRDHLGKVSTMITPNVFLIKRNHKGELGSPMPILVG